MSAPTLPRLGLEPVEDATESDGDTRLWSVTTIIGTLDKPAIVYWAAEQTAAAAVDDLDFVGRMLDSRGRDETVKWLRDAQFRAPKDRLSSSELGTVVHKLAQDYALSGAARTKEDATEAIRQVRPTAVVDANLELVGTMWRQFADWCDRFQPAYQAAEVTVYSPTYGYAGTCDGFLTVDGVSFIIDYKTSAEPLDSRGREKTPYPEVALQLAAYRYAELCALWRPRRTEKFRRRYYLLSADEQASGVSVPQVDAAGCIHITPNHCELFPVVADRNVHTQFLYQVEAARWPLEMSKSVVGAPIEPPNRTN